MGIEGSLRLQTGGGEGLGRFWGGVWGGGGCPRRCRAPSAFVLSQNAWGTPRVSPQNTNPQSAPPPALEAPQNQLLTPPPPHREAGGGGPQPPPPHCALQTNRDWGPLPPCIPKIQLWHRGRGHPHPGDPTGPPPIPSWHHQKLAQHPGVLPDHPGLCRAPQSHGGTPKQQEKNNQDPPKAAPRKPGVRDHGMGPPKTSQEEPGIRDGVTPSTSKKIYKIFPRFGRNLDFFSFAQLPAHPKY